MKKNVKKNKKEKNLKKIFLSALKKTNIKWFLSETQKVRGFLTRRISLKQMLKSFSLRD